jgi:hypothetical protein
MFSLCTLLYGDHFSLAERCLSSILSTGAVHNVADIRIGLNQVCPETEFVVETFTQNWLDAAPQSRVTVYESQQQYKYPMMRRMFYDPDNPLADTVMWFDDDSYVDDPESFWKAVTTCAKMAPGLPYVGGQVWSLYIPEKRRKWLRTQRWYEAGKEHDTVKFPQGAFWFAPSWLIQELNWPIPELKHCGGDSLLGEILHHQGINIRPCSLGVRVNADEHGNHSRSKRRGYTERELGYNYDGKPLPTDHQDFDCKVTRHVHASGGVRQGAS